jgi:DNA polymerase-1
MAKTLYLIDGHAQIYRAYFAPFRPLTSPTGEPTRATYIFCQMLLNLIRDRRPDYLVMVLDADESKLLRRRIYPEYKAHREPPPEDLPAQERRIVSILEAAGVPILVREGYEADDIIATLVWRYGRTDAAPAEPLDIFIVSRDKDLDQLLGPRITLFDPMKGEVVTAESLLEAKGWRPDQATDAQILTGDSVDNVPGVPGIGPKTAATLLQKYGTVEGIIAHVDELAPKQRENLVAFIPQIPVVRQLVTLQNDVPVELELEQAACVRFAWGRARPLFEELGFRRLLDQLPEGTETQKPAGPQDSTAPAVPAGELREPVGTQFELVNTPEKLAALAERLAEQREFAIDTETTAISPIDADLVGLSFAWEVGRGCYVPVRSVYDGALPLELVRAKLGPLLADTSRRKVGQNLKYDLNVLRNAGLPVGGALFDTMIAAFVLDPTRNSNSLDALAFHLFGYTKIPTSDLLGKGRDQLRMDQVPIERVAEYAAEDADYTWRLRQLFEPQLAPAGLERLYYDVEMPLVSVLTDMEYHGIRVDVDFLRGMSHELTSRAATVAGRVQELAGRAFNLDSPKQLAEVLFDKLGYRVVRRTKTTRSTDAETLEELSRDTGDPIFGLLLEYRELQKLLGTYVDALPRERSRRTERIHTSYHQTGTVTGRLSSSAPNLQNIPIRTEAGRQIRRAFVPRSPEELLIVADYSQVELRVLAHFCEDEALRRAFVEDQDIHAVVAAQVNGVPLAEVTKEQRGRAKAVNFGIIYGQTAFGLAQSTGMGRSEAQAFIDDYFRRYPRIREFIDRCVADAKRAGQVRTILGRRRPIENIDSRNASVRAQAERFAVNTVIQGSAADLIKIAMIQLHGRIVAEKLPLRMLLQVHDELVCEGPRADAAALAELVRNVMTQALTLRVPLKVDVSCGENWLEAK